MHGETSRKSIITLCASFSFYEHVCQVQEELESLGWEVIIPETAVLMKKSGVFSLDPLSTLNMTDNSDAKTQAMRKHIDEVRRADAILVINDEKHNIPDYIGPNVLIEMAIAFADHIPIYLINNIPAVSPLLDELKGLKPIPLLGNLKRIKNDE
ncbi:MAG: hypothetical protein ABIQ04_02560 [Candidatus Saccharimonadales bacterium]